MVLCWHRGAGKDLFALNALIWRMVEEPAVYLHCFPQYSQGKKAIWNSVHKTDYDEPMGYLEHFPKELVRYKNSTEMRIELVNGAIYCVMGMDGKNAQLARGMNPTHVIMSEYAYMDPLGWETLEPRVSQNKGTCMFLSTPNGKNHFYNAYNYAISGHDPDWFGSMVTNDDTKIHTEEHIKRLREEGRPEDFIQQEYFCDFNRGAQGSYYGTLIQQARNEGRLDKITIVHDLPCHTAWDIGVGDSSALWVFQILRNGNTNFLHYYENQGTGLNHYIEYLQAWRRKYGAIWGTHYVPHDMQVREFATGISRLDTARDLGIDMQIVPKLGIDEGIQMVRALLPQSSFDVSHTRRGIDCLDFYRKKWNESLKVYYDEPCHDQYSHGADAMRTAAVGVRMISPGGKLSADEIRGMRQKYLGY
jgi:hypothetical protein